MAEQRGCFGVKELQIRPGGSLRLHHRALKARRRQEKLQKALGLGCGGDDIVGTGMERLDWGGIKLSLY